MTPQTPLDDVEFLARSPHRVRVLRTLYEGPRARSDIHEETGIPQATLGRILGSFQERNWAERRSPEYALTPFGELIVEEFDDLLETVETVQHLGEVVGLLPTETMDFDVREFADARITVPGDGNAFRHLDRLQELIYGAESARMLIDTIPPGSVEEHSDRAEAFRASEQWRESIQSAESLDQVFSDPNLRKLFRDSFQPDRAKIYRYEGEIPLILAIADDVAILAPTDDYGIPVALVESDDETIRAWVDATLDDYRSRSEELRIEDIPE